MSSSTPNKKSKSRKVSFQEPNNKSIHIINPNSETKDNHNNNDHESDNESKHADEKDDMEDINNDEKKNQKKRKKKKKKKRKKNLTKMKLMNFIMVFFKRCNL